MNLNLFKLSSALFVSWAATGAAAASPELPQYFVWAGMVLSGIISVLTIRSLWYEGSKKREEVNGLRRKRRED